MKVTLYILDGPVVLCTLHDDAGRELGRGEGRTEEGARAVAVAEWARREALFDEAAGSAYSAHNVSSPVAGDDTCNHGGLLGIPEV